MCPPWDYCHPPSALVANFFYMHNNFIQALDVRDKKKKKKHVSSTFKD